MSVEHMALVFAAEGLDGSEKLLLLAYTNYTDAHGYCWPGEDRLADDTGTSPSTVRRVKKKLIGKNLVKSMRRPETSNLTRVNLPLLASMGRKRTAYDDNEMERLSFTETGSDQQTVQSDLSPLHSSDLRTGQSDLTDRSDCSLGQVNLTCGPGQSDLQSLSDPEVDPPSPLRPPLELVPSEGGDQEGGGGDAPPQREEHDPVAAAFVDRLPYGARLPGPRQRAHLIERVTEAFAAGWEEWTLRVQLTEETASAKSLAAVYRHRLDPENLPAAPPLPKPRTGDDSPVSGAVGGLYVKCQGSACGRKMLPTPDGLCRECREDVTA
ncbi:helix-turn-helix domain-containing protein [Streptomyces sp. NPDC001288]